MNLTDLLFEQYKTQGFDGDWYAFLVDSGYSGNVNDMLYKYLRDKGYTGSVNDMLFKAASDNALFGLAVSITTSNVLINSQTCDPASGSLSASVNGGTAPYTYSWTKVVGDGTIASPSAATTNIDFVDLCPQENLSGTYQVQVTDANNDTATAQATITAFNEAVLPLSLTMSSTDGTAESETPVNISSTVSVSVSGGITPYSYSWVKTSGDGTIVSGGTTSSATVEFTNVAPEDTPSGVFEVTVTDNQGTVATNTVSVGADNTFVTNPFPTGEQGIFLDASDLSTMYQDSAGTTPVTAAGQPVGRWEDKSGNAYIFNQTTSTKRPVYQTDGTYHWVDFDGVDDAMVSTANVDMSASDEVSLFGSYQIEEVPTSGNVNLFVENDTNLSGGFRNIASDIYVFASRGTSLVSATATGVTQQPFVMSQRSKISANYLEGYVNGVSVATTVSSQGAGNYANRQIIVGEALSQSGLQLNGRIYSVLVMGRLATAQEQTDIEAFMAEKAGVTL